MTLAFIAFLLECECQIPPGEPLDLKFKIVDGNWFALLTVGTPFGVMTEAYQFNFDKWLAFSGGA